MTQHGAADVVVVGGGVIGLGIAWRAAQAGITVTVVDQAPGRGASWAAAGMLAPVTEVHYGEQPLLRLNLDAAASWPAFAAELEAASGRGIGYRRAIAANLLKKPSSGPNMIDGRRIVASGMAASTSFSPMALVRA